MWEMKVHRSSKLDNSISSKGEPVMKKNENTAEKILNAAFNSIAKHGCGAVTLRGIAEEAGVALSQLNYYYGNKDKLFVAVLNHMQQEYLATLETRLEQTSTIREQIIALVDYNEYILHKNPDTYRNFLEFFNFAMCSKGFQTEVVKFTYGIASMIEKNISRGESKRGVEGMFSASVVTRYILSASFGIALQHFLSPRNQDIWKGFEIIKASAVQLV